jgi:hypothetical protein
MTGKRRGSAAGPDLCGRLRGGQLWAAAYRRIWNSGSGSMFQFGKALPIREYFPEARDYKTFWKPAAFRSNVAVVRGGATP